MLTHRICFAGCLGALVAAGVVKAGGEKADFHKAYYLEVEERQLEEAIELYEKVLRGKKTPEAMAAKARRRLATCQEGLRARDLARLMPADVLAYAEVRSPGKHLQQLVELAGLGPATGSETVPFAVSPRLLEALRDAEGAAAAVTGVDFERESLQGVVILNLGPNDLLPGLVETGLSGAIAEGEVKAGPPVGGHPCYRSAEGSVVVTRRLIIAGSPHRQVVEAVERLASDGGRRLEVDRVAPPKAKREDSLLFAFVNAPRVVELVKSQVKRDGQLPEDFRVLQALADLESVRWAGLRVGTYDEGISGDVWLRLEEDNHALVYHLVRTPTVGRGALSVVPPGVAACLAFGLSEEIEGQGEGPVERARVARYVTGLDVGREVFANVRSVVAFVLPQKAGPLKWGPVLPDVGVVFDVKDSSRSQALWSEFLSIPAAILQARPEPVRTEEVDGQPVQVYAFDNSLELYLAALPRRVILATSARAVSQVMLAAGEGGSVLEDAAFQEITQEIDGSMSKLFMAHAGRVFAMMRPFLHDLRDAEAREIEKLLAPTTLVIRTTETPTAFDASFAFEMPHIGRVLREMHARKSAGTP